MWEIVLVPAVGNTGKQCLTLHKQRTIESAQEMDVHKVHHDIDHGTELQHQAERELLNPPHTITHSLPRVPLAGKKLHGNRHSWDAVKDLGQWSIPGAVGPR